MFEDDGDRSFGQPRGGVEHGQPFFDMALDDGEFGLREQARLGRQLGIESGVADVLDHGAERQLFDFRLGQALMATEGNDQRGGRHGVFGGVGIQALEAGQRHEGVGVADDRGDHFADNRLEVGGIDIVAGLGREHEAADRIAGFMQ